jgi:hypothetical protein
LLGSAAIIGKIFSHVVRVDDQPATPFLVFVDQPLNGMEIETVAVETVLPAAG